MSDIHPRFGVWAPHYGPWVFRAGEDSRRQARFALSREVAVSADRAGFDSILFAQHTIASAGKHENEVLEAWTACAAAAAVTEKIEIIAAIKPLLYHPAVLAKLALGIEDISGGRFAINFVNAFSKPELENSGIGFPEHDARYAYGAEWLRIVKALMSGESVTHRGEHFRLTDYQLKPAGIHRTRPRIYAGGESEPARVLAAELVDTLLIHGRPPEEIVEIVRDLSRRPRAGAPITFGTTGFVSIRPTDGEAEEFLQSLFDTMGQPDSGERALRDAFIDAKVESNNRHKRGGGGRHIGASGGVAAGFVGSYDRVARRLAEFCELGVTTFLLSFFPLVAEQERFAQEVIPRVRALLRRKAA